MATLYEGAVVQKALWHGGQKAQGRLRCREGVGLCSCDISHLSGDRHVEMQQRLIDFADTHLLDRVGNHSTVVLCEDGHEVQEKLLPIRHGEYRPVRAEAGGCATAGYCAPGWIWLLDVVVLICLHECAGYVLCRARWSIAVVAQAFAARALISQYAGEQ
eukprot:2398980-Prymnesium_polylepis.1